jgi:hypothetical protein
VRESPVVVRGLEIDTVRPRPLAVVGKATTSWISLIAVAACVVGGAATAHAQDLAPAARPAASTPPPSDVTASPPKLPADARVAVEEFSIEGVEGQEVSPALDLQLEDGFVLAFARAGIAIIDSAAVHRKLENNPELKRCEIPLCFKRLGEVLRARYLMRVKITVVGNGYKATARLLDLTDSAAAGLPVKTQSSACDICTVAEAREMMIKLGDAVRIPIEDALRPPPPPPPPPPPFRLDPSILIGTAFAAAVAGAIIAIASPDPSTGVAVAAGALIGGGLTATAVGVHALVQSSRTRNIPARRGAPGPAAGRPIGLTAWFTTRW